MAESALQPGSVGRRGNVLAETVIKDMATLTAALKAIEPMLERYPESSDAMAGLMTARSGAAVAVTALEGLAAVPSPSTG